MAHKEVKKKSEFTASFFPLVGVQKYPTVLRLKRFLFPFEKLLLFDNRK